jgi:hypothetical protein
MNGRGSPRAADSGFICAIHREIPLEYPGDIARRPCSRATAESVRKKKKKKKTVIRFQFPFIAQALAIYQRCGRQFLTPGLQSGHHAA